MREKLRWWRYWHVTRRLQRAPAWAVRCLVPRWVKYWAFIEVTAEVTAYPEFRARIVPEIGATEVLAAYRA